MPENATILADKLVIKMKEEIKANPVLAPGIFMNYYYQTYSKFNFIQHKQRRKFFFMDEVTWKIRRLIPDPGSHAWLPYH